MLPRRARLSSAEVRQVLKTGKSLHSAAIVLKYTHAKHGKAAVVVSKKVAKTAVRRNSIRRAVYDSLPRPLPYAWAVFLVQKNIADYKPNITTLCSKLSS